MPPRPRGSLLITDGDGNITTLTNNNQMNGMIPVIDNSEPSGMRWIDNGSTTYVWNGSTPVSTLSSNLKQWYGKTDSTNGTATFNVTTNGTSNGPSIFNDLSNCIINVTTQLNSTSNTQVSFASVRQIINNKQIEVNVKTGNSGSILIGGTYVGIQNAPNGTTVHLSVIGE